MTASLILALPKGRILNEVMPIVRRAGIEPESAFDDPKSRQLMFATNQPSLKIIRVRAFDAASFAAYGAAHLAVVGGDVLQEFSYPDLYSPLDLNIGQCRLSLASLEGEAYSDLRELSHIRVATKYPQITSRYFANLGIQAECVALNGAMEIAPALGLAPYIVDLVSSGDTLRANHLVERQVLYTITSRLVVNRPAFKIRSEALSYWVEQFRQGVQNATQAR